MAEKKKVTKKAPAPKKATKTNVAKPQPKSEPYDIEARTAKVKAIENKKEPVVLTLKDELIELSNKRCKLVGELMGGDRVPGKEEKQKELLKLNELIAAKKIEKVKQDQKGR